MATVAVHHSLPPPAQGPLRPAIGIAPATRSGSPVPKSGRHINAFPSGSAPVTPPVSPPQWPEDATWSLLEPSCLYPPTVPPLSVAPPVYSIDASHLAMALEESATRHIPETNQVFPWLHGLHPDNSLQTNYFAPKRRARRAPRCLRGITIVKAGGDLTKSRLKGAVSPEEILGPLGNTFLDCDPKQGFSVRNFHIQMAKLAQLSDIVVYGDDNATESSIFATAVGIATAQADWMRQQYPGVETPIYNTFILSSSFSSVISKHPELIAVDVEGQLTSHALDFARLERAEMCAMSRPSEIAPNVWMGPTPDGVVFREKLENLGFDVLIDTYDMAEIPERKRLLQVEGMLDRGPQHITFPGSGSILPTTVSQMEIYDIIDTCKWIHKLTNPVSPTDDGNAGRGRSIYIHCADGYTESSLLGVTYFMFATGLPLHEAWIRLHKDKQRDFFAYPSDVAFLTSIQQLIIHARPTTSLARPIHLTDPDWMTAMDGSLPSRILPHMYLGSLIHANNPGLLRMLGIRRILSIGEPVSWLASEFEAWGAENMLMVDDVQDNGIDSLTPEIDRCLSFIEQGKIDNIATLVHCRVGVSRSASICIAHVMAERNLSFARAYCFVRARRLNVIIQPHLRFVYELLRWEGQQQITHGQQVRREIEWGEIAREIAALNRPYSRVV